MFKLTLLCMLVSIVMFPDSIANNHHKKITLTFTILISTNSGKHWLYILSK